MAADTTTPVDSYPPASPAPVLRPITMDTVRDSLLKGFDDFRAEPGVLPTEGTRVQFEEIHVGGKGPRAMAVQPMGWSNPPHTPGAQATHRPAHARTQNPVRKYAEPRTQRRSPAPPNRQRWVVPVMLLWAAGVLCAVWLGHLPWWMAGAFLPLLPLAR